MSWEYDVRNSTFTQNGSPRFSAMYAGAEGYKNDPAFECIKNNGPLPRGTYTIEAPHFNEKTGRYSLRLIPDAANSMCGRSAFLIHGDSNANPGKASNGCIIASFNARKAIWNSGDRTLVVK